MKIPALERTIDRAEAPAHYAAALIAALAPDPALWEYRGEMIDGGISALSPPRCACGHPIRWLFPIYLPGTPELAAQLGSTCILHYAAYRPDDAARMQERLAAMEAELAAALAKARRVKSMAEVAAARERHAALTGAASERYEYYRSGGLRAPRSLWWAVASRKGAVPGPDECPQYTRPADARRWHEKHIAALIAALTSALGDK